jgi:DNA repair protein RecO (recombination protein O)
VGVDLGFGGKSEILTCPEPQVLGRCEERGSPKEPGLRPAALRFAGLRPAGLRFAGLRRMTWETNVRENDNFNNTLGRLETWRWEERGAGYNGVMAEQRSFRAQAVVLRHANWGEADRILTLYTREHGKLRAIVKGARKIRSRKAGHLEPFTHVTLQLARGRDIPIITQVETVDAYLPLREDLLRTGYASYMLELLDRFTYEEEGSHPALFRLLTDSLARLCKAADPWLCVRYYEMRLLDYLGFRPQLFNCANCQREILPEDQFFSPSAGGVICPRCGQGLPGLWGISVEALKYLRHFQRSSYSEALRANPTPAVQKEVETLMQAYFTYLLERKLNTPGVIKRMREGKTESRE